MSRKLLDHTARKEADASEVSDILRELNLAKVVFQGRAINAVLTGQPFAASRGVKAASSVPSAHSSRGAGDVEPQPFGAVAPRDDDQTWRWATDFPSPHKMRHIGDD